MIAEYHKYCTLFVILDIFCFQIKINILELKSTQLNASYLNISIRALSPFTFILSHYYLISFCANKYFEFYDLLKALRKFTAFLASIMKMIERDMLDIIYVRDVSTLIITSFNNIYQF